jgi:hypothetical protein
VNLARYQALHRVVHRRRLPELANRRNASARSTALARQRVLGCSGHFRTGGEQRSYYSAGDRSVGHVAEEMGVGVGSVKF